VKAAWMKVADDRVLREVNWKGRVINRKGVKEQKWGLEKTALIKHMMSKIDHC